MPYKLPCPVCFLDGFKLRHGVALSARGGVWLVDCGTERIHVWCEDIFFSTKTAQAVLNSLLN